PRRLGRMFLTPTASRRLEIGHDERVTRIHNEINPGQQVGKAGDQFTTQFFLDAENDAGWMRQLASLEGQEHSLCETTDGIGILAARELDFSICSVASPSVPEYAEQRVEAWSFNTCEQLSEVKFQARVKRRPKREAGCHRFFRQSGDVTEVIAQGA